MNAENKKTIDERLSELGWVCKEVNNRCSYIVYQNEEEDRSVTIEVGVWIGDEDLTEDCYIHSESISTERDWYGCRRNEPRGLTLKETNRRVSKIEEMIKDTYGKTDI